MPLIRNVTVFALQYAVDRDGDDRSVRCHAAALVGRAISGGTTGYFLGRTIALLRQYRRQRSAETTT